MEDVEKLFSYPFYWPIFLQKSEQSSGFFDILKYPLALTKFALCIIVGILCYVRRIQGEITSHL